MLTGPVSQARGALRLLAQKHDHKTKIAKQEHVQH
jgi:hypothetical protein